MNLKQTALGVAAYAMLLAASVQPAGAQQLARPPASLVPCAYFGPGYFDPDATAPDPSLLRCQAPGLRFLQTVASFDSPERAEAFLAQEFALLPGQGWTEATPSSSPGMRVFRRPPPPDVPNAQVVAIGQQGRHAIQVILTYHQTMEGRPEVAPERTSAIASLVASKLARPLFTL